MSDIAFPSLSFYKPGVNGYAHLTLGEGHYRAGNRKLVLRFYKPDGSYHKAFFVGSGSPYNQDLVHPSKDYPGSGRIIPEGFYEMPYIIRQEFAEAGVGYAKIPLDQVPGAPNGRSDLLIHVDFNASTNPGTLGCVFPATDSDFELINKARVDCKANLLVVDLGQGYVTKHKDDPSVAGASTPRDAKIFSWAYQFVSQWESGYVNNPSDPGGETNFGITQAFLSQVAPGTFVRDLTPGQAKQIYWEHVYEQWGPTWFLNLVMFDTTTNFGAIGARMFLQEALGFEGDDVDGKVGVVTLGLLAKANQDEIARKIVVGRAKYRHQRVAQSPSQDVFLEGWLNRDRALARQVKMNPTAVDGFA